MRLRSLAVVSAMLLLAVVGCTGGSGSTESTGAVGGHSDAKASTLVFTYGDSTLNTEESTFTRRQPNGQAVVVTMKLSPENLARISAKMEEIGLASYPDKFVAQMPAGTGGEITPAQHYRWVVTTASGAKTVDWTDNLPSQDAKAIQLRELATLIEGIVRAQPEYKNLPTETGGYL
jgi:hypothetical protein